MLCLTGARFNMKADILRQTSTDGSDITDNRGEWVNQQNPETGTITRKWVPIVAGSHGSTDADVEQATFPCIARGVISQNLRGGGTDEIFGEIYNSSDYVLMQFPANVRISVRDRVTNIRDSKGNIIWVEEQSRNADGSVPPTIYEVTGVTPIPDPFGRHIESQALLQRAQTQ